MHNSTDFNFTLSPDVVSLGLQGQYFLHEGFRNVERIPAFDELLSQELGALQSRLTIDAVKSDPILLGFRRLHEAVGCSNRRFVAAPESLLLLLAKRGFFPRVNLLVDIYNLVSLKSRLALGAHDLAKVDGHLHLRLTVGDERFVPLGASAPEPVRTGEYAYIDDANDVVCRLEVKQVEKTKIGVESTRAFFIVQGNAATPASYVSAAVAELQGYLERFCGGSFSKRWQS